MGLQVGGVLESECGRAAVDIPLDEVTAAGARDHLWVAQRQQDLGLGVERYAARLRDLRRLGDVEDDEVGAGHGAAGDHGVPLVGRDHDGLRVVAERNGRVGLDLFC